MKVIHAAEVFLARDLPDRTVDVHLPILMDLLFYLLHLVINCRFGPTEILVFALADTALYLWRDEKDRLEAFHNLPKLFLLDFRGSTVLTLLGLSAIAVHLVWNARRSKTVFFFLGVALSVFVASHGTTKVIALSFVTWIMASYMYMWESLEPPAFVKEEQVIDFQPIENKQNEEGIVKNQAIAQRLVTKLKRLKMAMVVEEEHSKKQREKTSDTEHYDPRSFKRTRSKSLAEKDSKESDKSDMKDEELVLKNMLDLTDLKQLIEILVSHNTQEMKYWLPKDILSVLNNEEVSAYLWAYLNTQDMIPSPRAVKQIISLQKTETIHGSTEPGLGENFNFDLFAFDKANIHQDSLVVGCMQIYKKFGTLERLGNLPDSVMTAFLHTVQSYYFSNYYHNSIHALDVTNSCAYFLRIGLKTLFSELETITLLISATLHDVGHPGFNNAFMVAVGTTQSLIYNDQSVLENYHCSLSYQIIQKEKNNILKNLSKEDKIAFRKVLINNILSTDLGKHFPIIKKFESAIDVEFKLEDEQNRHMAMAVALNAKSLELHKIWSRRVTEEFWNQGDHEIELGIPATQLCDRKNNLAKSQDGFIGFLAKPLFDGFGKFLVKFVNQECFESYNSVCIQQLVKNKEYWMAQIEKGDAGNEEFMEETEQNVRNIKLSPLSLDSLLNFPDLLLQE